MNISANMNQALSATMMQNLGMPQQQQPLTDAQKQKVNDILSNYNSSSFSQNDFKSIFQQFKASGIPMGDSLKSTAESAGFDFSSNIQAAMKTNGMQGPGGMQGGMMPPPPPKPSSNSESSNSTDYTKQLSDLLASFQNGKATQSDFENFINAIKTSSSSSTGNLFSASA